ncbi:MAG: monovalent cation/H+ antiporter complex subunit F [Verrucomicrobiales bacterium]|nr:monovalent cation/H+ antiporter complex subunit F [Verrucomicrobiales bacterium]
MIEIAFYFFVACLFASIVCGLVRIWRGPTVADRLNAADVVALCCVGLAVGQGWHLKDAIWLDVAMIAGLVLFVGTTAVSLFLDPEHLASDDDS